MRYANLDIKNIDGDDITINTKTRKAAEAMPVSQFGGKRCDYYAFNCYVSPDGQSPTLKRYEYFNNVYLIDDIPSDWYIMQGNLILAQIKTIRIVYGKSNY